MQIFQNSETSRTDGDGSLTTETFRAARLLLPNSAGSAFGPQSNSYLFQRSPNITSTVREFVHRKEKPINYYLQRSHMCVYFFLNISFTRHQLGYIFKNRRLCTLQEGNHAILLARNPAFL